MQTSGRSGGLESTFAFASSLGGGEKNLLYPFPFITQPGSPPSLTRISEWKGNEGAHLSTLILRSGRSWDLGDNLPQLSQPGGLVTITVSDLKSERPKNGHLLSSCYCCKGDAAVALARLHHDRAVGCV